MKGIRSKNCPNYALAAAVHLCMLYCVPPAGFSQLRMPELRPVNSAVFLRQVDAFDWRYLIGYGGSRGRDAYAAALDIYTSMIDQADERRWKDNLQGFLSYQKVLGPSLALLARFQQIDFHDELSAFNYDRAQTGVTLASRWRLLRELTVQPEAGYRWEFRPELQEAGPYAALSFQTLDFTWAGYRNRASGLVEMTRFARRKNANARANFAIYREFSPGTRDSLAVFYDFLRRDNYFSNTSFDRIETLQKSRQGFSNTLAYRINERVNLTQLTTLALGGVEVRERTPNHAADMRSHSDFDFSNSVSVHWAGRRLAGTLSLDMAESSVNYSLPDSAGRSPFSRRFASIGYDLTEKSTRIGNHVRYRSGEHSELRGYLELAKTQHDITDTTANDSYDEQKWQASVFHRFPLGKNLTFSWQVSMFLKHFVYLDRRFSAQNNWKRLLQLEPAVSYTPAAWLSFRQRVGVQAQYVEYDFETAGSRTKSYVVRNFYLFDSLALALNRQLGFTVTYQLELEELGSLNWAKFTSRPRTKLQNHWLTFLFTQQFAWPVEIGVGALLYKQSRWQFRSTADGLFVADPIGSQLNFGPLLQFSYRGRNGSHIYFSGQRQKSYPFQGDSYFINQMQLSVQWTF